MDVLDRLAIEVPIVQAGMGGGIATGRLAGAVSAAGALGTVGMLPAGAFSGQIERAREIAPSRPIAANLLLPHLRRDQVDDVIRSHADVVVLFFGTDRDLVERVHAYGATVLQQVGTVAGATAAIAAGVDGLIVQGREAGGHLVGVEPVEAAIARIRGIPGDRPLLAAGGVATREDVLRLLAAGADAVVAGTRFLLTEESRAHDGYKQRVVAASRTLETELFGVSWPARHRVVPNAVTDRWCQPDEAGPRFVRTLNRVTAPLARRVPLSSGARIVRVQRAWMPLFTPQPALVGMPDEVVDVTPLYAGESALRMGEVTDAASAVRLLAGLDAGTAGSGEDRRGDVGP